MKHFIDLSPISKNDLRKIINIAKKLKTLNYSATKNFLEGKNLAMIFEKPSTRTRISFEVAINQLGGKAIVMNKNDMQLGKGETISDTAKVLSRFVDVVMIRCRDHNFLVEMSQNATIPVINGLSDYSHPCQILASILTIEEHFKSEISGKTLSWFGDANNVLNSYIQASVLLGYNLNIAIPQGFNFCDNEIAKVQKIAKEKQVKINIFDNAENATKNAAENADVLIADTWVSMGQSEEADSLAKQQKLEALKPFQVNQNLMNLAKPNAVFTHCLPAYRGFEVTADVIDGTKSIVFDEAENRLHIQKAILLWLFGVVV